MEEVSSSEPGPSMGFRQRYTCSAVGAAKLLVFLKQWRAYSSRINSDIFSYSMAFVLCNVAHSHARGPSKDMSKHRVGVWGGLFSTLYLKLDGSSEITEEACVRARTELGSQRRHCGVVSQPCCQGLFRSCRVSLC